MRETKFHELIQDSQLLFIRKQVTGYKWMAIKKGNIVYVFTDGEMDMRMNEVNKRKRLHLIGNRKNMIYLIHAWREKRKREQQKEIKS